MINFVDDGGLTGNKICPYVLLVHRERDANDTANMERLSFIGESKLNL